jgi:hypothetical protein
VRCFEIDADDLFRHMRLVIETTISEVNLAEERQAAGEEAITPWEYLRQLIAAPRTLNDDVLLRAKRYIRFARELPPRAFADAMRPPEEVVSEKIDPLQRLIERYKALELMRLWFNEALRNYTGGKADLHILAEEKPSRYRLVPRNFVVDEEFKNSIDLRV